MYGGAPGGFPGPGGPHHGRDPHPGTGHHRDSHHHRGDRDHQGPGGAAGGASSSAPVAMYDPLTAISVDKLNVAYAQRHLPGYTGSYMGLVSS